MGIIPHITIKSSITFFIPLLSLLAASCTDYSNQIYIDNAKKAIISCKGSPIREVIIEGPDDNVTYEGVDTIYCNRKTSASQITVATEVDDNYILMLKPNSSYEIRSYSTNGDQGPFKLVLKTDGKGNVIHDDENNCQ